MLPILRARRPRRALGVVLAVATLALASCSFLVDFPDDPTETTTPQVCQPHVSEACAADATATSSACAAGTRTCAADGSAFGPCQCAGLLWGKSFGSATGTARGTSVAVAPDGSIVVAGLFTGSINLGGATLSAIGASDLFVAKLTSEGEHAWSKSFGDSGDQTIPPVVAIDSTGAVVLAGGFTGTINFGGTDIVAVLPDGNSFVAKFDASGAPVWSNGYGDSGAVTSIDIGGDDSIALAGFYKGDLSFGPGASLFTNSGLADVFIARLESSSAGRWVVTQGTSDYSETGALVRIGPSDETIVAGVFNGDFIASGPLMHTATTPIVYAARYSQVAVDDLEIDWISFFDGAGTQTLAGLALDGSGNAMLTGHYKGTLTASPQPALQSADSAEDFFFVKLAAADGAAAFAKVVTETGATLPMDTDVDATGATTIVGSMNGPVDFGGGQIGLAPGATDAAFLVKYGGDGAQVWSKAIGAADALLTLSSIATDRTSGDLVVTGNLVGDVDLGTGVQSGTNDLFIARFKP